MSSYMILPTLLFFVIIPRTNSPVEMQMFCVMYFWWFCVMFCLPRGVSSTSSSVSVCGLLLGALLACCLGLGKHGRRPLQEAPRDRPAAQQPATHPLRAQTLEHNKKISPFPALGRRCTDIAVLDGSRGRRVSTPKNVHLYSTSCNSGKEHPSFLDKVQSVPL